MLSWLQSLTAVARGERLVEAAGVFSANEEADDVQTNDLRYLLLPFFQGELLAAAQEARQLRLRQALAAYDRQARLVVTSVAGTCAVVDARPGQVLALLQTAATQPRLADHARCWHCQS